MKRKVLCVFSLILYLLAACTILSPWIKTEMMTKVKISERKNRGESFSFQQSVLFSDEEGAHLYDVIDGTGWNSGLRAHELLPPSWYIDGKNSVKYDGSARTYRFIYTASRKPRDGEEVAVIEEFEKGNDQYLCIYMDGIPEEIILPRNAQIAARSENALLLNMTEAELPFFEHAAKGASDTLAAADRIISLTEAERFLEELPSLVLAAIILAAGVVIWAFSCLLSIRAKENKVLIRLNVVIVAALLCALVFLLQRTQLPASMLPAEIIFDLRFYSDKFKSILGSIETLSNGSHSILATFQTVIRKSGNLFVSAIAIMLAFILGETIAILKNGWKANREKKDTGK